MPDRCVEEGGILLVSGTPWPSPRVPIVHSSVTLSVSARQCPALNVCWLWSEASFRPRGTANPSNAPPQVCVQICSNWGVTIPGQGFLLGIAPAGWQNACGVPRVSIPGLAGLACVLPQPWEGHRGSKGPKGTIQRHRPPCGRCAPRAVTVRAHRLQSTNGPAPDGRMDGQAHGSRDNKPRFSFVEVLMLVLRSAGGREQSCMGMCM